MSMVTSLVISKEWGEKCNKLGKKLLHLHAGVSEKQQVGNNTQTVLYY